MPGPRDADMILRVGSSSDLTADETKTITVVGGIYFTRPLAVNVLVPKSGGGGKTLKVTAKFTTDGERIEVTHTDLLDDATTYPFHMVLPLPPTLDEALSVVLDVTGGSEDFGAVEVWLEGVSQAQVPKA